MSIKPIMVSMMNNLASDVTLKSFSHSPMHKCETFIVAVGRNIKLLKDWISVWPILKQTLRQPITRPKSCCGNVLVRLCQPRMVITNFKHTLVGCHTYTFLNPTLKSNRPFRNHLSGLHIQRED